MSDRNLSAFLWSVADLLRGDYKQSEYGKVILPFTVLRRLDCVLEPTKADVLAELATRQQAGLNPEPFLLRKVGGLFFNTSPLDLKKLMGDQDHIGENLRAYVQAFSPAVRDIFDSFDFHTQIDRLAKTGLLYLVTEKFAGIDLHPDAVSNAQMGAVFEELIRKFAELSNETAGEHFTPREVIRLMVNLLFIEDDQALIKPGVVRSLYDPTAGTGGMLSVAGKHLASMNAQARLVMYGQELNPESYAICKADMLIKGQDIANIVFGNTLSNDGLPGKHFDYMLSNPPFGVEWKKIEKDIRKEAESQGFAGRFGPGLPRTSDGSLLFLLHLLSKMRPAVYGGSRFDIVLNGSPLFTGGAGSGESETRRYTLENDLVEEPVVYRRRDTSPHSINQHCRRPACSVTVAHGWDGQISPEILPWNTSSIHRATASTCPSENTPALPRAFNRAAIAPSAGPTKRIGLSNRSNSASLLGQSSPRVSGRWVTTSTLARSNAGNNSFSET